MIIRLPRLQPGKIVFTGAKRLLQQYRRNADVRREADVSQVPNSRERNRMSKATSGYFPRSRMSRGLSSGAHSRGPAAHARLLALRGAETNFRVRNCRRFHLKALDHLVLLIVFLLRR
jgi:hypothetical protein